MSEDLGVGDHPVSPSAPLRAPVGARAANRPSVGSGSPAALPGRCGRSAGRMECGSQAVTASACSWSTRAGALRRNRPVRVHVVGVSPMAPEGRGEPGPRPRWLTGSLPERRRCPSGFSSGSGHPARPGRICVARLRHRSIESDSLAWTHRGSRLDRQRALVEHVQYLLAHAGGAGGESAVQSPVATGCSRRVPPPDCDAAHDVSVHLSRIDGPFTVTRRVPPFSDLGGWADDLSQGLLIGYEW